jgi:hypothetical protein
MYGVDILEDVSKSPWRPSPDQFTLHVRKCRASLPADHSDCRTMLSEGSITQLGLHNLIPGLVNVISGKHVKALFFVALLSNRSGADVNSANPVSQAYVGYQNDSFGSSRKFYSSTDGSLTIPDLEAWIKVHNDKTEGIQVVCNGKGVIRHALQRLPPFGQCFV